LGSAGTASPTASISDQALFPVTADRFAELRVSLSVPESSQLGSIIPIAIRLENTGNSRLDLFLRGRTIAFDVLIRDAAGSLVWHHLEGEIVPAIVQIKVLEPGQVLELSCDWNQRGNQGKRVKPGLYTAQGVVFTDDPVPLESSPRQILIAPS
jgi:hypothetical protein